MTVSDEPTRVSLLTSWLAKDRIDLSTALDNGAMATLTAGAEARDDCAVFSLNGALDLVVGSDYVRGAGFSMYERGLMTNYDIGYYLAVANLSDVAAMGARPIGLVSVIRYPRHHPRNDSVDGAQAFTDDNLREVVEGIKEACAVSGVENVGGDIGSADELILSGTALGVTEPGTALRRNGARPGDLLFVSGVTGIAGAAMKYFRSRPQEGARLSGGAEMQLAGSWRRPRAEVELGRRFATSGIVTSCQDTSDGLKATIEQIAEASGCGFDVEGRAVPVSPLVRQVATVVNEGVPDLTFGDSVDFRLVFTVPPEHAGTASRIFPGAHHIGHATRGSVQLVEQDGTRGALPGTPWRHADPTPEE